MADSDYAFARISDGRILDLFQKLLALAPKSNATFSAAGIESFSLKGGEGLSKEWAAVLNNRSHLITNASAVMAPLDLRVHYNRGRIYKTNVQGYRGLETATSEFIDGLTISGSAGDRNLELLGIVNEFIDGSLPVSMVDEGSSALNQSAAILNSLSDAVAEIARHTVDRQKALDTTRSELEKGAAKQLNDLRAKLERDASEKSESLIKREEELASRSANLDDRENTHVRRELQKGMAALSDSALQKGLLQKSWIPFLLPIFVVLIGITIIAVLIFSEFRAIDSSNKALNGIADSKFVSAEAKSIIIDNLQSNLVYSQIRIALQSLGAAALAWFGLRFATTRYRHISKWESDLHKFRLDTERASFLIEGDLEARKVNDQGLPEVMLDRFSRGLFESGDSSTVDSKDAVGSTLSALLNRSAVVKLGPSGVEVEIDKSGMRRARKDLESESES